MIGWVAEQVKFSELRAGAPWWWVCPLLSETIPMAETGVAEPDDWVWVLYDPACQSNPWARDFRGSGRVRPKLDWPQSILVPSGCVVSDIVEQFDHLVCG